MNLLDGKKTSEKYIGLITEEIRLMKSSGKRVPHLAAILVGNDGASETYIGSKIKTCEKAGFTSSLFRMESTATEKQLLDEIESINNHPEIDGLIVQLPLPEHISAEKVSQAISPRKDVDGFHPVNTGRLAQGLPCFAAATPKGIITLIKEYKIETAGKHCVIIGRSNIVGMPLGLMLSKNAYPGNCTVTLCHSKTQNLAEISKQADILIAALGKAEFVTGEMVKRNAVVIDVGITRVASPETKSGFKLKGDVHFESVAPLSSYITPVPGGVGPMTIIGLLQNTLTAAKSEIKF